MQAVGMVNDHVVDCFRYEELKTEGSITNAAPDRLKALPRRALRETGRAASGIQRRVK